MSGNQIAEMWPLPRSIEVLNLNNNCLKRLNQDILKKLNNLNTLEISSNGLESLQGISTSTRLKRLIAKNNQIASLEPCMSLTFLIEVDLENNPIDSYTHVVQMVY